MGFLAWAKRIDDRVLPQGRRIRRRTALRLGCAFFAVALVEYVLSYVYDDTDLARSAALMALFAGIFLGRAQEHDLAKKGLGLDAEPTA